jgi:putative transposase
LPPSTELGRLFLHRADRLVRRDSTVLIHKRFYEVPAHLTGRRVEVRFDPLELAQLEVHFEGQFEGIARAVDAVVNAQLPPRSKQTPETGAATGINYIEMLHQKEGGDV